jgi:hypothetical protein
MYTWNEITRLVLSKPAHQDVVVHKSLVPHPRGEGFAPRLGDFQGQIADFGKALPDGKGITFVNSLTSSRFTGIISTHLAMLSAT